MKQSPNKKRVFKEDWQQKNPGLHLLYLKWAVKHLRAVDKIMKTLSDFSNGNLMSMQGAVYLERKKLVDTNAAYADAHEILVSLGLCQDYKEEETES
jgi:hypothetical protein